MKTKTIFSMALIILFAFQKVNARIWRVNNFSNFNGSSSFGDNLGGSQVNPIFKEINNAIGWGAVNSGDTLHVEGSSTVYATATITKKLVIIGPGYFLPQNPQTSTNGLSASIGSISFNTGSAGSQLIGMNVIYVYPYYVHLNANNLTLRRCRIENTVIIGSNVSNINIVQNFFSNSTTDNALYLDYPYVGTTDLVFNNNICQKTLIWDGTFKQCNNNVFDGPPNQLNLKFTAAEFKNNILKPINATVDINNGSYQNIKYNIGTSDSQFGTANGNKAVVNMNDLFVNAATNTTDGDYQLQPGSPGSNNGSDGTNRGAFGGLGETNRYTLSGLAPIPVIYEINTTGVAGPGGLPVSIKARTIQ